MVGDEETTMMIKISEPEGGRRSLMTEPVLESTSQDGVLSCICLLCLAQWLAHGSTQHVYLKTYIITIHLSNWQIFKA